MKRNKVRFYGIKCEAIITDTSFELFGKNDFQTWLIDRYAMLVLSIINARTFVYSLFGVDIQGGFMFEILDVDGN